MQDLLAAPRQDLDEATVRAALDHGSRIEYGVDVLSTTDVVSDEEVLVEGPSRTDPALLRGRTRRNTTVNFTGEVAAGELVLVSIERASSTTLGGAQAVRAAA